MSRHNFDLNLERALRVHRRDLQFALLGQENRDDPSPRFEMSTCEPLLVSEAIARSNQLQEQARSTQFDVRLDPPCRLEGSRPQASSELKHEYHAQGRQHHPGFTPKVGL